MRNPYGPAINRRIAFLVAALRFAEEEGDTDEAKRLEEELEELERWEDEQ